MFITVQALHSSVGYVADVSDRHSCALNGEVIYRFLLCEEDIFYIICCNYWLFYWNDTALSVKLWLMWVTPLFNWLWASQDIGWGHCRLGGGGHFGSVERFTQDKRVSVAVASFLSEKWEVSMYGGWIWRGQCFDGLDRGTWKRYTSLGGHQWPKFRHRRISFTT